MRICRLLSLFAISVSLFGATTRISCGGSGGTDSAGNVWAADSSFAGGAQWGPANQPALGNQQSPYKSLRYSAGTSFSYQILVPVGNYNLTLKFLEPNKTAAGQRIFSVNVNGVTGIQNLDVFQAAGGSLKSYDRIFPVSAPQGSITLNFVPNIGNSMVSGIQLDSVDPPPPALAQYLELAPIHPANLTRPTAPNVRLFSNADNVSKIYRMDSDGNIFLIEAPNSIPTTICTDTFFDVKKYFTIGAQTAAVNVLLVPANTNVTDVWIIEDATLVAPGTITGVAACVGTTGTPCGYAGSFPLMGVSVPQFRQYPSSGSIAITSNSDQYLQLQLSVTGGAGNLSDLTVGVVRTRICTASPLVTLGALQRCQGESLPGVSPIWNCGNIDPFGGLYKATMHTQNGPLTIVGVTGIGPDPNTWTPVQ